jgi:hypothetical protein
MEYCNEIDVICRGNILRIIMEICTPTYTVSIESKQNTLLGKNPGCPNLKIKIIMEKWPALPFWLVMNNSGKIGLLIVI